MRAYIGGENNIMVKEGFSSGNLSQRNLEAGKSAKINARLAQRILVRLDRLNTAPVPEKLNLPGFDFHALSDFVPT